MPRDDPNDKIVLSSEAYPTNSKKAKDEKSEEDKPKLKQLAVAKRVKKPFLKRLVDSFKEEGGSGKEVGDYVLYDVIVPAAKATLADLVEGAMNMVLFGGETRGARGIRRDKGRSYVSYADMYDRGVGVRHGARRPHNVEPALRSRHDFSGVIMGSRGEAEEVLSAMVELVTE